jgi:hypothetical protein
VRPTSSITPWREQSINAAKYLFGKVDFGTLVDVVKRGAHTYADYKTGGLATVFNKLTMGRSNNANSYKMITGY